MKLLTDVLFLFSSVPGCFRDALEDFEKAVHLNPGNKEFRLGLEDCRRQLESNCLGDAGE